MGHLIKPTKRATQAEAAHQLIGAHAFLVARTRTSIGQLAGARSAWGGFAKRANVDLSGPDCHPLVAKPRERIIEAINMAATLERLLDALRWFAMQPEIRDWLILECHPSTSSTRAGNDLVLGPSPHEIRVCCEVTDVVSSSAGQNQKERRDLKRLGCDARVPQDGVRRFICTSREFGRALSAERRQWATRHYSYRLFEIDETVLLELGPPSAEVPPNQESHPTRCDGPTAAPRRTPGVREP